MNAAFCGFRFSASIGIHLSFRVRLVSPFSRVSVPVFWPKGSGKLNKQGGHKMKNSRTQKRNEVELKGTTNLTINGLGSQTMTQTAFGQMDVVSIQMVRERKLLYNGARLTTAEQAAEAFCALIGHPDREFFVCLLLDGKNRIAGIHTVSQGSLNQTIVHPREAFKAAILANSAAIIIAHNHPSGDLTPSREDMEITRRLKEAGELLGIKVLDHIIVDTETGTCSSFANQCLI
jgi:DNA repair protein RadC